MIGENQRLVQTHELVFCYEFGINAFPLKGHNTQHSGHVGQNVSKRILLKSILFQESS